MRAKTLQESFDEKHIPEPNTGCWLWIGRSDGAQNYGIIDVPRNKHKEFTRRSQRAHRISWYLHRGTIPANMWVLHKCDTPACVNPAHLFLGDRQANIDDMMAKGRQNQQKKTHCSRGHVFAGENVFMNKYGRRVCRECSIINAKVYRDKINPHRKIKKRSRIYGQ